MKRALVTIVVAGALLLVVLSLAGLDLSTVQGTLTHLDLGLVAASFAVYATSYVARGLRLLVLLPGTRGVVHLSSIAARHIFLAVALPFRTGEAAMPVLLQTECRRPVAEGLGVLGLMRLLDLVAVGIFLLIGLMLRPPESGSQAQQVGLRAGLILAALCAALLLLKPVARRMAAWRNSPRKALAFVGEAAASLEALGPGRMALSVVVTLLGWLCTYGACFLLLRAMADPAALGSQAGSIDFATSLIGTTGLHLAAVMPISPVASVGTWEAGWFAGYTLVGMSPEAAGASGIVSHVVIMGFITVLGLAGWLVRPRRTTPGPGAGNGRGDRI
ncbi:MAG: lysylphosphatidylglycerol synthase transmembrane domain-containing protein [Planctomycetota bacterium]